MAEEPKRESRLFKNPYVLASQFYEQLDKLGVVVGQINGGALTPGDTRELPQEAFSNALTRPFVITKIRISVTRRRKEVAAPAVPETESMANVPASSQDWEADYNDIQVNIRNLVTNEDLNKDPVPLSGLLDRERREWQFFPGKLIIRKLGGGLKLKFSVNTGAPQPFYNVTVGVHGYTEEYLVPSGGMFPEEA